MSWARGILLLQGNHGCVLRTNGHVDLCARGEQHGPPVGSRDHARPVRAGGLRAIARLGAAIDALGERRGCTVRAVLRPGTRATLRGRAGRAVGAEGAITVPTTGPKKGCGGRQRHEPCSEEEANIHAVMLPNASTARQGRRQTSGASDHRAPAASAV